MLERSWHGLMQVDLDCCVAWVVRGVGSLLGVGMSVGRDVGCLLAAGVRLVQSMCICVLVNREVRLVGEDRCIAYAGGVHLVQTWRVQALV